FIDTIHLRADYQRIGYFYPELAMYFKNPQRILGSFFVKDQGYRVRIDDIEHFLSGYVQYQKAFKD
ncbi:poly(glycerol-phosphate) alpha-glucosyltransferase, partial [Pseudomonas aeruginosa]